MKQLAAYAIVGALAGVGAALAYGSLEHSRVRVAANYHKQGVCWYAGGVPVLDRFGNYRVCRTRGSWSARLQ